MRDSPRATVPRPVSRLRPARSADLGVPELDEQVAVLLPRRDTLCNVGCVDVTTIVGVNFALAVNAASANVTANAVASQYLASFR